MQIPLGDVLNIASFYSEVVLKPKKVFNQDADGYRNPLHVKASAGKRSQLKDLVGTTADAKRRSGTKGIPVAHNWTLSVYRVTLDKAVVLLCSVIHEADF